MLFTSIACSRYSYLEDAPRSVCGNASITELYHAVTGNVTMDASALPSVLQNIQGLKVTRNMFAANIELVIHDVTLIR